MAEQDLRSPCRMGPPTLFSSLPTQPERALADWCGIYESETYEETSMAGLCPIALSSIPPKLMESFAATLR